MGYTTTFHGEFAITPPLTDELTAQLNQFCEARHNGPRNTDGDYAGPLPEASIGIWCDWQFTPESMSWNGNEKSYDMAEWADHLLAMLPPSHTISGDIAAEGEDSGDHWRMVPGADGRSVKVQAGSITYQ